MVYPQHPVVMQKGYWHLSLSFFHLDNNWQWICEDEMHSKIWQFYNYLWTMSRQQCHFLWTFLFQHVNAASKSSSASVSVLHGGGVHLLFSYVYFFKGKKENSHHSLELNTITPIFNKITSTCGRILVSRHSKGVFLSLNVKYDLEKKEASL